jgi:diguanylate cyclase
MTEATNEKLTDWKQEYRGLVDEVTASEHTWRELESLLRRAARQLAIAAMGQSDLLDASIESVLETIKTELSPVALADALEELSESLRRLPRSEGSTASDAEIALVMGELIARITEAPVFEEAAKPLTLSVERALSDHDWGGLARGLADTVAQVTSSIQTQKCELEEFLKEVTHQLEQFDSWVAWNREADVARRADGSTLETSVDSELRGIQEDIDTADEGADLKLMVRARLDAVAAGLRAFKASETARRTEAEAHDQALSAEVKVLRQRTDDLTEVVEKKETQLLHDALTGVHSRYAYEQRLNEEFHRWQRHGGHLAFSIWDIDRFKLVNDSYGHSAGDRLLGMIGKLLSGGKREEDFLARIGGEEFALLLPATNLEQARQVVERIRTQIAATAFHYKGQQEQVTLSCGLTEFRDGDTPLTIYQRADAALYRAKESGRNRCVTD